jgi:acyl-CoA synthetase (NDP forming)
MAKVSDNTKNNLKKGLPPIISLRNPLDLLGDATTDRYQVALESCLKDKNSDILLLIALYQTPMITTDIVDVISEYNMESKKPIIVVSTGAEFTENLSFALEESGIPTFSFPESAINAINKLVWYENKRLNL